ncbi:MAG: GDSL-type esterase/lipase family protein [Planctomycetota bacterium]
MKVLPAKLVRGMLLAVLAAGGALGAAEVAWRVFRTGDFGPTTNPRYVVHDEALGWRYVPGADVRHATSDFDVGIRINAEGYRDATPPAPGARPIVTLGDSMTFGWGVEEREAFPALLEDATGVPVANLGVSGFGTDQQLLLFDRDGARREPRAVVLTVCANDVEEVSRRRMYGRSKPFLPAGAWTDAPGWAELRARFEAPVPDGLLARYSELVRSLLKAREARRQVPLGPPDVELGRERLAALLEALAARTDPGSGTRLLVCGFEDPWLAAALAGRPGVRYLDLGPALAEAAREAPVRFESDNHWTPHGHAAAARAMAARLAAEGLLR